MRHYADIVPLGGSVQPLRDDGSISWTIRFRNGTTKRFRFPVRTTPEGSIDPYGGKPDADYARIAEPGFFVSVNGFQAGNPDELIRR